MIRQIYIVISLLIFYSAVVGPYFQTEYFQQRQLVNIDFYDWKTELVDSFDIPEPAINMALNGFYDLEDENLLSKDSLLTIIDFSSPSTEKRLYILDIKNQRVLKHTLVAHGMNTGNVFAESFSNVQESRKSSLGFYITKETYFGQHGYSLRIQGMSKGINDKAADRAIVIHGADYVSQDFIESFGRIGRSFGCPALPVDETDEIIDLIKNGSCLFIYHPSLIPISPSDLENFD